MRGLRCNVLVTAVPRASAWTRCSLAKTAVWHRKASSIASRNWSTPLAKTIAEAIQTTGPISIAQFMRQCLTSPQGGYYTTHNEGRDQFGQKGDFVTSPEISQVFGELLGLWVVAEWMGQGRIKQGVQLIEVGPGRGTLMDDMLRTFRNFKALNQSIESVYLVEASSSLREKQHRLLCGSNPLEVHALGHSSRSTYSDVPVIWCEDIRFVPNDPRKTPFIIAHEFFDALPIHVFQSVPPNPNTPTTIQGLSGPIQLSSSATKAAQQPQWREIMVSNVSPGSTAATTSPLILPDSKPSSTSNTDNAAEFQLIQAKASTPSSILLPELSDRYKALKSNAGNTIEISPESHSYAASFANRIGGSSSAPKATPLGAALILDYGTLNTIPVNTLRGIRQHKLVNPLTRAGETDLSADVDFTALADAALEASPGVEVHGPVEQGNWLAEMGARERVKMLISKQQSADTAEKKQTEEVEERKKRLEGAVERLMERGGGAMGKIYKVMAIVPERGGKRPVGFGGALADN